MADETTAPTTSKAPPISPSTTVVTTDHQVSFAEASSDEEEEPPKPKKFLGIFPRKAKVVHDTSMVIKDPDNMGPFPEALKPSSMYNLIDPKNLDHLRELGGTQGLLDGLKTNATTGLTGESLMREERLRVYGENKIPQKETKGLLKLMWIAFQDKVLIILTVAAVVSLALGLYQDLGTPAQTYQSTKCANNLCKEPQVDWVEGVAIMVAIVIVVVVGAVNDYQKELQFQKLNAKKEDRNVKALRDGKEQLMSVYDVVVGDVLFLEPGEIIPVDGVFLSGHNMRCDESGATGESDAVRKASFDDISSGAVGPKYDCFLISGSKVLEGVGSYVVTGVGRASFHGRILLSLSGDSEVTPLQLKLNALAEIIAKLGSLAGLVLFAALMIRFFVELGTNPDRTANDKAQNFINILIIAVTIVVVAVPEGLPLAVTLALAFATRRMTKQNLLVRVLGSCETMANATVVCTDKTGTLTTNKMTVVDGMIGLKLRFVKNLADKRALPEETPADAATPGESDDAAATTPAAPYTGTEVDMSELSATISPDEQKWLNEAIALNTTAFEGTDEYGNAGFVGSKTETALLAFAKAQNWADYKSVRESAEVVQAIPFSSERKAMGVVYRLPSGGVRFLLKGASEVLAGLSTRYYDASGKPSEACALPGTAFDEEARRTVAETITAYTSQSLRTISLCARDFPVWPPADIAVDEGSGEVAYADIAQDLTLCMLVGIQDPLREGVAESVRVCQRAGVQVKMCTGDNVMTARAIARECGIYTPGGAVMEGPEFRRLSDAERAELVPRLQVLARSSPEDKKILVDQLKALGEIVGVTGDGTNDGPALKTAHVGFSMGIAGTEVAKEASDIILMDDNFSSIVSAIMWGRCVNDSVRKFLQFQIAVNITAVIITFVSAVASSSEESVLSAVQLLWVNLIMDTFAALALATDPATPESLERQPDRRSAPLITVQMWLMIASQAAYQTIVTLVLHFAGASILNFDNSGDEGTRIDNDNDLKTLVFNCFVFCQIFNMFNARRLDRKLNIFTGVFRNVYFMIIFLIMVGGQVLIVEVGGSAFQVTRIGGRDWGISIVVGFISLPIAALIKLLIPPAPVERALIRLHLFSDPNAAPVLPTVDPQESHKQWNKGIDKVINNLQTFRQIRGGRVHGASFLQVYKTKDRLMREKDIHPTYMMAMVPGLIISSVGAGWRPDEESNGSTESLVEHRNKK